MPYFNTYGLLVADDSELFHYGRSKADGAKRGSGRYPLGSGERPHQHDGEGDGRGASRFAKKESKKEKVAKATGHEIGSAIKKAGAAVSKGVQSTREAVDKFKKKRLEAAIDRMERNPKKFKTKEVAKLVNQMSDEELNARIEMLQQRDVYKQLIGKKTFGEIKQERIDFLDTIKNEFASSLVHQVIVPGVTGLVVNKLKNKTYAKESYAEGQNAATIARNRAIDQVNDLQYEVKRRVEEVAAKNGITDRKTINAAIDKYTEEKVQKLTGGKDTMQWVTERAERARESAVNEYRKNNKPNPLDDIYKNTNGGSNNNNKKKNNNQNQNNNKKKNRN